MALKRTASQSETLWNYDASLAVDGDANTCSFTPQSDVQRWWQVRSRSVMHVVQSLNEIQILAPRNENVWEV